MTGQLNLLFKNLNEESFYLELNNEKIYKNQLEQEIKTLKKNLTEIIDIDSKKVFMDVKERKLFIVCLFALLELNSKIVLVPNEIKPEDYLYKGGLFLTDNKNLEEGIFIKENLHLIIGNKFDFNPDHETINDNTMIYLYTSGSTGKVKLIPKTSENLLTELRELTRIFFIEKSDIFYFTPPLFHIYGILFGLLLPLYNSSKIIIDNHFTPESIAEFIKKKNITNFISIPSYYKMFSDLELTDDFIKCKKFFSSSAPLNPDVSKKFYEKDMKIHEIYGSTETGGIAHRVSAENPEWNFFSYVKIANNKINYLEGENDKITELKIISPSISVSYDIDSGYNTGDIIELSKNNHFILLGRNTRFAKIKGKRLDLNYVSDKVRKYLNETGKQIIKEDEVYAGIIEEKIYIIFEGIFNKNIKEMKDELKNHLPSYAVPRILVNSKIPRNQMGKINKVKIEELVKENIKINRLH